MQIEKLLPVGASSYEETASGFEFGADEEDVTLTFITDSSTPSYSLNIYYVGLDGDGVITLERSNDGVYWSDVVGDDGIAISFTATGTGNKSIINYICGNGYTRINYANTDNTEGIIGANLQRG